MAKRKSNQRKKNEKKIEEVTKGIDLSSSIYSIAGILLFILAFYLLTLYITNKNTDKEDDTPKEVEISSEKILVGNILNKANGDYLVLCYDFNNEADSYDTLFTTTKSTGSKIYKVDLSNGFNKKYVTDGESNKNPTSASEFLINGATLIKVSDHKVVEYIEGYDSINSYLN